MTEDNAPAAVAHRGRCTVHPKTRFPVRVDWDDARQDTITHLHQKLTGGHHIDVELIELRTDEPVSGELYGFPPAGYAREPW